MLVRARSKPINKCSNQLIALMVKEGMLQLFAERLDGVTVAMPVQLHIASRYVPAKTLTRCFCHNILEGRGQNL